MNVKKALPIIALLGIGAWWYFRRNTSRITYGAVSTRVHSINLQGLKLVVTLPIINGSDITATVQAFIGNLFKNGSSIGVITMPNAPVKLTPFRQTNLEFEVQIGLLSGLQSIAPDVFGLITNPPTGSATDVAQQVLSKINLRSLRIQGTLKVDGVNIDINQTLG